jgi:hypothetical protein
VAEHYGIFIKSEIVPMLLNRYKNNSTFYVIESIGKLVEQVSDTGELNALEKQGLYQVNQ